MRRARGFRFRVTRAGVVRQSARGAVETRGAPFTTRLQLALAPFVVLAPGRPSLTRPARGFSRVESWRGEINRGAERRPGEHAMP